MAFLAELARGVDEAYTSLIVICKSAYEASKFIVKLKKFKMLLLRKYIVYGGIIPEVSNYNHKLVLVFEKTKKLKFFRKHPEKTFKDIENLEFNGLILKFKLVSHRIRFILFGDCLMSDHLLHPDLYYFLFYTFVDVSSGMYIQFFLHGLVFTVFFMWIFGLNLVFF